MSKGTQTTSERDPNKLYPRLTKELAAFFGYSTGIMYRKIKLMIERGIIVKEPGFHDWDIAQQEAMIDYLGDPRGKKR